MNWVRSKDHIQEYSTLYLGLRHYIAMTHKENSDIYHYVYSKNGERIHLGYRNANNWDEAEQIALLNIRRELSWQAERWNKLLDDFNKAVSESETLG